MNAQVMLSTPCGELRGRLEGQSRVFTGVRYASAKRWKYPELTKKWDGVFDATGPLECCPQTRTYVDLTHIPERAFYYNEFRRGLDFIYGEDCLRLSVWTPLEARDCPVVVYIHGGGFNSGSADERCVDGAAFNSRDVILVCVNYRVGVLGYMTGEELLRESGGEGNYGLADQCAAVRWVKENIAAFGGDPENITLLGQSAGAISIQYMQLSPLCEGLFEKIIFMSGGGIFPKFALPKLAEDTHEYWDAYMRQAGVSSLAELRALSTEQLVLAFERHKSQRKDNQVCCMPVVDARYIPKPIDELAREKRGGHIPTIAGTTREDMFTLVLYGMAKKWTRAQAVPCYTYFFDRQMPGDDNGAFHSSDLWYAFGTLSRCWRPFDERDKRLSDTLIDYFSHFAKTGDPNAQGLPVWEPVSKRGRALCLGEQEPKMGRPNTLRLLVTTLKNKDPRYAGKIEKEVRQ